MSEPSVGLMQSIGQKPGATLPAFFRFREVAGKVIVTSLDGSFAVLTQDEFRSFAKGDVARGSELWTRLAEANLIKEAFDVPRAVEKMRARKRFVHYGPNLHIVVVT